MDTAGTDERLEMSPERDKAIRLFTYLKDLCALRTTQVRNVTTYDQVFWLNDLPRHRLCRCTVWRLIDPTLPPSEPHNDPWLEVRKPVLKSAPEIPDDLEPWIKDEEITDSLLSEPGILLKTLSGGQFQMNCSIYGIWALILGWNIWIRFLNFLN